MPNYTESAIRIRMALQGIDTGDEFPVMPPPEGDDRVAGYVKALWEESRAWRRSSLYQRFSYENTPYNDPLDFFRVCRYLEQGMHWRVWGRRNQDPGDEWKQELIDNEIGNQIRVRKSYLTANWHDVSISPNVANISEILDQERHDTDWGRTITSMVMRGLVEGTAILKTIFDRSENPAGVVREILVDNASIFPAPYSEDISRLGGCWYLAYATLQPLHIKLQEYPGLDPQKVSAASKEVMAELLTDDSQRLQNTYAHTSLVDVIELWVDDPSLERIPPDKEEIQFEHEAINQGVEIAVKVTDDDRAHIDGHLAWMDELSRGIDPTVNDQSQIDAMKIEYMLMHVGEHLTQLRNKIENGVSVGKRSKYPFGRKIVVIGGQLAEDNPSPFRVDWRALFHKWDNERLPGHFWGRGVPEILWETNRTLDTMLSRTADIALTTGIPKKYYSIEDRNASAEQGIEDNDPLKPAFVTRPPTFVSANAPRDNMELYSLTKQDAKNQLGVQDVSYGKSPGAQVSGRLVEILLNQNQIVVSGEANENLSFVIEDILETRVQLYKSLYTEPRIWFVDGFPVVKTLSDELRVVPDRDGNMIEVPKFQIFVRPNSNMPRQFEMTLALLTQLMTTPSPDGTPLVTRDQILDLISQRYPQFGRGSKYYQEAEATKIGMQVMAQQQAEQQEKAQLVMDEGRRIQQKGLRNMTEAQPEQEQVEEPNAGAQ